MDEEAVRDEILSSVLINVAFDGWIDRSVKDGAELAGYDMATVDRVFPDGVDDMIRHWSDWGDRVMRADMAELDLGAMRLRDRIATAVRRRIEFYAPHKEAARRTIAHLALPGKTGVAFRNLGRTVDAIWQAAGDRSADMSYYTKRATLLPVYVATVLYWLDDESDDIEDTWGFLARRIDDVMRVPKLQARLLAPFGAVASALGAFRRAGEAFGRRRPHPT